MNRLQAPFPWFGGKSAVADVVWERLGSDVPYYVEPFGGSLAVLLARPGGARGMEIVNDADGFIANFWRAVKADPDAVAEHADWPVNENDLHARHYWLVERRESLVERLEGDPDYYDAKIAGWWVWGQSCWIGAGWCAGDGPWRVFDGRLIKGGSGRGIGGQIPRVTARQGVPRKLPEFVNRKGVNRQLPEFVNRKGVNRQRPHLGDRTGVHRQRDLRSWMRALADRLRDVIVCCGDWTRVASDVLAKGRGGPVAYFLDPPYSHSERAVGLYAVETDVAAAVREWALARGDNPRYRIALCGYEGEHEMPPGWSAYRRKAQGGYGNQDGENENARRETIWFSPHCLPPIQGRLL